MEGCLIYTHIAHCNFPTMLCREWGWWRRWNRKSCCFFVLISSAGETEKLLHFRFVFLLALLTPITLFLPSALLLIIPSPSFPSLSFWPSTHHFVMSSVISQFLHSFPSLGLSVSVCHCLFRADQEPSNCQPTLTHKPMSVFVWVAPRAARLIFCQIFVFNLCCLHTWLTFLPF